MTFKPGNPGGPGRPPLPPEVKEARKLTRNELEKAMSDMILMTPEQLQKVMKDPESIMLHHIIASIIKHGISKGDHARVNWLTEQLFGKLKDNINVDGGLKVIVEDFTK